MTNVHARPSYVHGVSDDPLIGATIGEMFDVITQAYAAREAVVVPYQNVRWTYAELRRRVDELRDLAPVSEDEVDSEVGVPTGDGPDHPCADGLSGFIGESQLEQAIQSHRLIGQAVGVLIERHRVTPTQGFEMLRRASLNRNIKLRELAARVVESGQDPQGA